MSKKIQLTIPKPCHEDWGNMTPVEKGRFCGSCQKQVVDFTNMSDSQLVAFFKKKSTGSVCGRFMPEQLDRTMDIPKKRIPWVKYFFQLTLPLFIASLKSNAQKTGKVLVTTIQSQSNCTKEPDAVKGETRMMGAPVMIVQDIEITGLITGADNLPVPYASIVVKGTTNGVQADSTGAFSIKVTEKRGGEIALIVSSVGYKSKDVVITPEMKRGALTIQLEVNELKEVIVGGYGRIICHHRVTGAVTTLMGDTIAIMPVEETKVKNIGNMENVLPPVAHVYPNPLPSGTAINIKCENMEEDYYSLQLMTMSGQAVFSKEIWVDKEAGVLNIVLPHVRPGTYLLIMASRQKKKKFTEKIIILP